jgi:hypothetical protein
MIERLLAVLTHRQYLWILYLARVEHPFDRDLGSAMREDRHVRISEGTSFKHRS